MVPRNDLTSTRYCLAHPGTEYLVYAPDGGEVTVDLLAASGTLVVEWFDPKTGLRTDGEPTTGGASRSFAALFDGDAVLYIVRTAPRGQRSGKAGE